MNIDISSVQTPCWIVEQAALRRNLELLKSVQDRTGCKILLALKGFAMFGVFPLVREYLGGVCASSPDEARLGAQEFGKEVHAYAPAYSKGDVELLVQYADHIIFNSFAQWHRFRDIVQNAPRPIECGLRINPEYSEVEVEIYNPCAVGSRLGIRRDQFDQQDLSGISGLHMHTMCEQNSDTLQRTLKVVDEKFGDLIRQMKWLNLGGGHHITRPDYDVDLLVRLVSEVQDRYDVEVILEPGEAVGLNTGVLVAQVLDIVNNGMDIAILDTSAAAHMPDVLEMPYRPNIVGADHPGKKKHTYRLGGMTCLAGDVIGDYSFDEPLEIGSRIVLLDMAHYTMVKTNTFNGVHLPSIAVADDDGKVNVLRTFGYEDYRNRLS